MLESLHKRAADFPDLPGVYILKGEGGKILYVGKAQSLKRRIRAYLADRSSLPPRLRLLQDQMREMEYVVTDNEVEALVLECNLIKEHRPRFNVNLKDDKDYPYLILTGELYPRLELLRLSQRRDRRGRYHPFPGREERRFGPYTNAGAVRDTMRLLSSIFPLRRCRQPLDGSPARERPCLNYQMKRCLAPCRGMDKVPMNIYDNQVRQVVMFLEGRYDELEKKLKDQMRDAAAAESFEEAAAIRDRLQSLSNVTGEQQKVLQAEKEIDRDIAALAVRNERMAIYLFKIRGGKLIKQDYFPLTGASGLAEDEVLAAFIKSYYNRSGSPPREVLLSGEAEEQSLLQDWLRIMAGRKTVIRVPQRGSLKKLVRLAQRNCELRLMEDEQRESARITEPLQELATLLSLPGLPERIEGYDISHLGGDKTVGVMVVFEKGVSGNKEYRQFNIREAGAGDDYGALQETLKRRAGKDNWPGPDLILIDGGKGQLGIAAEALKGTVLEDTPLLALAKNPDRIFLQQSDTPLSLPAASSTLQLLQRIRDEAHRFAVSRHRNRRRKSSRQSLLESIEGVGPARRTALLRHFRSIDSLLQASPEAISAVPGISPALANKIFDHLHHS